MTFLRRERVDRLRQPARPAPTQAGVDVATRRAVVRTRQAEDPGGDEVLLDLRRSRP